MTIDISTISEVKSRINRDVERKAKNWSKMTTLNTHVRQTNVRAMEASLNFWKRQQEKKAA
jgi:hypothetical protein